MASNQDALDKITLLKTEIENFQRLVLVYIAEVNSLTARFLAKLAAGSDTQPVIDELNKISLSDVAAQLQSAIDQAKIEGQQFFINCFVG